MRLTASRLQCGCKTKPNVHLGIFPWLWSPLQWSSDQSARWRCCACTGKTSPTQCLLLAPQEGGEPEVLFSSVPLHHSQQSAWKNLGWELSPSHSSRLAVVRALAHLPCPLWSVCRWVRPVLMPFGMTRSTAIQD